MRKVAIAYPRVAFSLLLAVFGAGGCAQRGQQEVIEGRSWLLLYHGYSGIPVETRERVSNDERSLRYFAALLRGEASPPEGGWLPEVALWWLAESGRSEFVPLFLEYADEPGSNNEFYSAIYGLARHPSSPEARAGLARIAASADQDRRNRISVILDHVNSDFAREVLRDLERRGLTGWQGKRAAAVLAGPPAPDRGGRWPCLPGTHFGRGPSGIYGCTGG